MEIDIQRDIFYCELTGHEEDGAVFLRTQAGEMMNVFLEDYPWKFAWKCHECDEWGTQKLICEHCDVSRPAGVLADASAPVFAV